MSKVELNALSGWRQPTDAEVRGVSRICEKYYASATRIAKTVKWVLCALGVFFLIRAAVYWIDFLFAAIMFLLMAYASRSVKRFKQFQSRVQSGGFRVLDGHVSCLGSNEKPGFISVQFTSEAGTTLNGMFGVRQEGVSMQTPLILVDASDGKGEGEFDTVCAFTPFMLTEEAAELKW